MKQYHDGPEPPNSQRSQCCELILGGTHFCVKLPDKCVQLRDGNIGLTRYFLEENGEHSICGQFFRELDNLYLNGVCSVEVGIFRATSLSAEYSLWCVKYIKCKCVCLKYDQRFYAIFCLTHLQA